MYLIYIPSKSGVCFDYICFYGACNFLQLYFLDTSNSNDALRAFAFKSSALSKDKTKTVTVKL